MNTTSETVARPEGKKPGAVLPPAFWGSFLCASLTDKGDYFLGMEVQLAVAKHRKLSCEYF